MPRLATRGNPEPSPPEVDTTAFQAAVSAAVTTAMAQLHRGNNGGGNGQGSGSSNNGTNQGPTKTCTYKDFVNAKPRTFNGTGGVITLKRWIEKVESVFKICECPEQMKVKFAACTFVDHTLTWWNGHVEAMTLPVANSIPWAEMKEMLMAEYCPQGEIQKMEQELWNLTVQNANIDAYISRFSELSLLCPGMITSEGKKIERFIWGLTPPIQGNVIAANPETFDSAKRLAKRLYDHNNKKGEKPVEAEKKKEGDGKKGWNNKRKGRQGPKTSKKQ